jgi:hypothetical protein
MYEPIRTKSVHSTMAGPVADFPHRSREEELDIQLAAHLAALLAVTDELRALTPAADLDEAAERLAGQVARLRDGHRPVRAARSTGGPTPWPDGRWWWPPRGRTPRRRSSPRSGWTRTPPPRSGSWRRTEPSPGPVTGALPIRDSRDIFRSPPRPGNVGFRAHDPGVRRIAGIVLAVLLIGGVVAAVVAGRDTGDKGTATKTVRAVIGSEKAEFFADPQVVQALAAQGYTVRAETSGSWAMEGLDLGEYDIAFPSSGAPADELATRYKVRRPLPVPFYSPLVVVAHRNAAQVLAASGLATLDGDRGVLRMSAYLDAAAKDRTWQQLDGADRYGELTGTLYLTTTDPESSNSGALYLAAASYVAAGGKVAASDADVDRTAPLMRKLVSVQGAQQSSSDAVFRDFVSGAGNPLVVVYESQVAALLADRGDADVGDLTVLYPDTTVNSDHTVVPLTGAGRALGELLGTDPTLRLLAVRHGFRPQGDGSEFTRATADHTDRINQKLAGIRQAPVPTSEVLRTMARRARG